ncbi:uncharacterized protein THITE_157733 [Thermothielavioides terrestris NRRL 8126]|uniref:Uncharacterized protein n=1 Tax=Thermothielavioides terrestris (strain ATCC 38088 / NRRL 8126) TaxID=578455 RepID=G2QVC8_THETT|nr:uncharacterized protein THITE_157733 [Thermothielavioides terrestris NRRL 8126]AEO63815.1 hypothetical protein THITE_157733 [Thermothielavioides terrestris NRRL 8126]
MAATIGRLKRLCLSRSNPARRSMMLPLLNHTSTSSSKLTLSHYTPVRPARAGARARGRPAPDADGAPQNSSSPDGRSVLVALPQHVDALRRRYTRTRSSAHNPAAAAAVDPPVQIEAQVVQHGSDEHRALLRQARAHHATRREALRARLGAEVVDELEAARAQLDVLDKQLRELEEQVAEEGGVGRLNLNFSKFGFDTKLRTYVDEAAAGEEGEAGGGGGGVASSAASSYSVGKAGAAGAMKLVKRPVIRQYFHRGLLWRSAEETEVLSFELFFDLLYVGIIAINGDHAAEEADGHELLRFVVTFAMSWRIWADVQQIISWFETDDILQRLEILFLIACLLGQTTNMLQAFGNGQDSFTNLVAFYLAARLFIAI